MFCFLFIFILLIVNVLHGQSFRVLCHRDILSRFGLQRYELYSIQPKIAKAKWN